MIRDRTEWEDLRELIRPLAIDWARREAEREARERRLREQAARQEAA